MRKQGREFEFTRSDFARARTLIFDYAGISLNESKDELVYSRLTRRLRKLNLHSFCDYLDHVEQEPAERGEFTNALTTNLTAFFREAHHFEVLHDFILQRRTPIRIWSGACSTGEEPYSIAITAMEALHSWKPNVEIIASDLDTQVLNIAKEGIYSIERAAPLDADRLETFFQHGSGKNARLIRVRKPLRSIVKFHSFNLLSETWNFGAPFDAIFLRNVFIYFNKETQYAILRRVRENIKEDGLLFIGHSETLPHAKDLFVLKEKTIYTPVGSSRR